MDRLLIGLTERADKSLREAFCVSPAVVGVMGISSVAWSTARARNARHWQVRAGLARVGQGVRDGALTEPIFAHVTTHPLGAWTVGRPHT